MYHNSFSPSLHKYLSLIHISLKATTAEGSFSAYLNVPVVKDANIWLDIEHGIVGSDWDIRSDANASGGKYVSRKAGIESPSSASSRPEGHIVYTINVKEEGFYRLHARVRSEEVNRGTGVSFYSNFDGADFKDWSVGTTDGWEWKELSNAYLLSTGTHTFTIAYRNGFLDKILITNSGTVPVAVSYTHLDVYKRQTWTDVANNAAKVLDYNGGINLDEKGHYYYTDKDAINALANGSNPKEIIWRANISKDNSSAEENHFPPSLFGNGRMNPTQNLVDAFPMANGYRCV